MLLAMTIVVGTAVYLIDQGESGTYLSYLLIVPIVIAVIVGVGAPLAGLAVLLGKWIDKTPVIAILCVLSFLMTSCSYQGYKAHLFKPDKSTSLVRSCGEANKPVSHEVSKTMKYYYKQKR